MVQTMNEKEIRARMASYKFYHIIKLTDCISTPGNLAYVPTQSLVIEVLKRIDLKGKRVLDIGCRDGLFSFESERLGSSEVIGIDNDLSKPAVEFLIPYFNSAVKMYEMNLYDLTPDRFGLFDVVIFAGVLYHLRYPFWGLKIIRDVLKQNGRLVLETAVWRGDRNHAMLYCPIGQESPYEPTSCTFFNEKGLKDTLYSLGIETDIFYKAERKPRLIRLLRKIKWFGVNLYRRALKRRVILNIDRALLTGKVSNEDQDQIMRNYWDGIHDFHTRTGG